MSFCNLKKLSLKTRFIYAFIYVIIFTITILSIVNYFRWRHTYLRHVRDEGLILTQTLAQGCIDPIIRHDFYSVDEYAKNLIKKSDIAYVVIMDRHNHVLARKPDDFTDVPPDVTEKIANNKSPYLIYTYYNTALKTTINDISVPIFIDSQKWGTVQVGFSLAYMRKEIARNIFVVMVTGIISVVIGIIVALILSRFVTAPIEKFMQSMKMVAEGNLDKEIQIESCDEFGVMARSFNQMARSLKKSKQELKKTYQQLAQKEKMAALGEFTANVAHEIKNPLSIIKSSAQILTDETKTADEKAEFGAYINDEINLLNMKVLNLLNFANPKPASFSEVDLNEIIEKKICFWESQRLEERKIRITRKFNRAIPHLWLDEEQVGEITLNMILNACDAMQDGGELIISTENFPMHSDKPEYVRLEFKDRGIGIPQENVKKIFDPFFTTKRKGNGLGLSIVYMIVENHKGRIDVESEEGKGTKFTILFPVTRMESL
ncbi:MAG: ATP-binding protein [bacterium]